MSAIAKNHPDPTNPPTRLACADLKLLTVERMCCVEDPADVLPAAAVGPPLSQIGDLWVLGRHRVFCGNALDCAFR